MTRLDAMRGVRRKEERLSGEGRGKQSATSKGSVKKFAEMTRFMASASEVLFATPSAGLH